MSYFSLNIKESQNYTTKHNMLLFVANKVGILLVQRFKDSEQRIKDWAVGMV